MDIGRLRSADADGNLRLLEELCAIKCHVVVSGFEQQVLNVVEVC